MLMNQTLDRAALVTRAGVVDQYLRLTESGLEQWVEDVELATPFSSMREAASMAARLPAALRAFGLPRCPEMTLRQ